MWDHIINIYPSELLCIQKPNILKLMNIIFFFLNYICKGRILGPKPSERTILAQKTLNNEFVESGLERYDLRHR